MLRFRSMWGRDAYATSKRPLVDDTHTYLHGFTGAPQSWNTLLTHQTALRGRCEPSWCATITGHYGDDRVSHVCSFASERDRLARELGQVSSAQHLHGYSLGGRLALAIAALAPPWLKSLTLIGTHPGLVDDSERASRRKHDDRWIRLLRERGIRAFVDAWEAQPLWNSQRSNVNAEPLAAQRQLRLSHAPNGLARAMAALGLGAMPPLWSALEHLRVPVRLVVGAVDTKFVAVARRMHEIIPHSSLHVVAASGHNVGLEKPMALAELLP